MKKYHFTILILTILILFTACKTQQKVSKSSKKNQVSVAKNNTDIFVNANKEKILGNINKAEELFLQCIENDPNDAASFFELSKIYFSKHNYDEAMQSAEKAFEISPKNVWYQLYLASLYKKNNEFLKAAEIYSNLIISDPENIDNYQNLAFSYIFAEKYTQAIETYNTIEDKIGISEEVSIQKQKLYLLLNKPKKAVIEIEKLCNSYPAESRYYEILAELCISNNLPDKALKSYKKILEIDPDNPYIHISLSDYYRKNGDKEKSYEELKLGFANPILDIESKIQIFLTFYSASDMYKDHKDQAFALADILILAHPKNSKAHSIKSDLLYRSKDFEGTRKEVRFVLSFDSTNYIIWEQLLYTELELNDYKSMETESSTAISLFPEQALLYFFNGLANFQLKDYVKSEKSLKRGIYFVAGNNALLAQFYMILGDVYHNLNNSDQSDFYYDKFLQIEPDNSVVLNNYAYYLSERGVNLELAETMSKKSLDLDPDNPSSQDTYGWILYKLNKLDEAKNWIKKSIDGSTENSAVVFEHYGDVLYKLGENQEAIKYWKKAKEIGKASDFLDKKIKDGKLYE